MRGYCSGGRSYGEVLLSHDVVELEERAMVDQMKKVTAGVKGRRC